MISLEKIIIGPILTEKGSVLTETQNKYLFKVKSSKKNSILYYYFIFGLCCL